MTSSTLRRWSSALESKGHIFEKNDKGQRIYYEHDYRVLREYKKLLENGLSAEETLEAITQKFITKETSLQAHSDHDERYAPTNQEALMVQPWVRELQMAFQQQAATIVEQNESILKQQGEMLGRMLKLEEENHKLREELVQQTEELKEIKEMQKQKKKFLGLF